LTPGLGLRDAPRPWSARRLFLFPARQKPSGWFVALSLVLLLILRVERGADAASFFVLGFLAGALVLFLWQPVKAEQERRSQEERERREAERERGISAREQQADAGRGESAGAPGLGGRRRP